MGTTKLLTVDELLKMSEDDYMDERQLAFFKNHISRKTGQNCVGCC